MNRSSLLGAVLGVLLAGVLFAVLSPVAAPPSSLLGPATPQRAAETVAPTVTVTATQTVTSGDLASPAAPEGTEELSSQRKAIQDPQAVASAGGGTALPTIAVALAAAGIMALWVRHRVGQPTRDMQL